MDIKRKILFKQTTQAKKLHEKLSVLLFILLPEANLASIIIY